MKWNIGDRVRVVDGSEAHGDTGTVDEVNPDFALVQLDEYGLWLVTEEWELEAICDSPQSTTTER